MRDYPLDPAGRSCWSRSSSSSSLRDRAPSTRLGAITVRQAAVLAILAGCQTLTMLTGGIDLSIGYVASMSGFVTATFVHQPGGWPLGVVVALRCCRAGRPGQRHRHRHLPRPSADHDPGHGPDRVRLRQRLAASERPDGLAACRRAMRDRRRRPDRRPHPQRPARSSCPSRSILILMLRRTGYGRMLYAIGDNPVAARLSGVRSWQVLVVLYVISALLAGDRRAASSRACRTPPA